MQGCSHCWMCDTCLSLPITNRCHFFFYKLWDVFPSLLSHLSQETRKKHNSSSFALNCPTNCSNSILRPCRSVWFIRFEMEFIKAFYGYFRGVQQGLELLKTKRNNCFTCSLFCILMTLTEAPAWCEFTSGNRRLWLFNILFTPPILE